MSHSGQSAEGLWAYTVNQTDLFSGWVECRATLGKGAAEVLGALDEMRQAAPFETKGLDSDNGEEFINRHLARYCEKENILRFRSRPYKKDDQAHIEQKNWTHVRKLIGWGRYDTQAAVDAMNDLYRNEWRLFCNFCVFRTKPRQRSGAIPATVPEQTPPAFRTNVRHSFGGDPATAG